MKPHGIYAAGGIVDEMDRPSVQGARFVRLPVLESILDRVNQRHGRTLEGFIVVAVQHLLETTGSLFEAMFSLGLRPSDTFLMGKIYSTCRQVARDLSAEGVNVCRTRDPETWGSYRDRMKADVQAMWDWVLTVVRRNKPRGIIILDDGGFAVASAPMEKLSHISVCAVEQTSSGVWKMDTADAPPVRVVQVASSAAKTALEPALISRAVLKRMRRVAISPDKTYGVIGMGNIGTAIAADLMRRGARTLAYDVDPVNIPTVKGAVPTTNLKHFFRSADLIFGCTGADVLANQPWWTALEGEKVAVSCSSHDQEFASVLRAYGQTHFVDTPLRDVFVPFQKGGNMTILRGGFPINFDNRRESVPANDIQLTRGLLLSGVIQAAYYCRSKAKEQMRVQLSPELQAVVVHAWFEALPNRKMLYDEDLPRLFQDREWIGCRSKGAPVSPVPF